LLQASKQREPAAALPGPGRREPLPELRVHWSVFRSYWIQSILLGFCFVKISDENLEKATFE
jgi:hypothetical protein